MIKTKKALSYILATVMIFTMLPIGIALAAGEPGITLGSAMLATNMYYYPNATISGDNIRTILINFSDSVTEGDKINLPAVTPSGFTISTSSAGNDYAKRISLDPGVPTNAIQDYIRGVGFSIAGSKQSVEVTITTENIFYDTYYNIDTEHYYQYISDTSSTWMQAYNAAKAMSFMGRTGYLATIMSQEEDEYVNSLSGGKTGWLGGSILSNTGTKVDASGGTAGSRLYYSGIDTTSVVSTGWYWACGPEIGTTFYNTNSLYVDGDITVAAALAAEKDAENTTTYYNWARGELSYEPNNRTASVGSANGAYETCLTTLVAIEDRGTNYGKYGTAFSWNDLRYNTAGSAMWEAKGYFVEYGDALLGDSGSASTAFASDSGTLRKPSGDITLANITWTGATSYTCGIELPPTSEMVTISVDSGYFTVPSLGGVIAFRGGTMNTSYISTYSSDTHFNSAVFSFADVATAETLLSNIIYSLDGATPQTITATSSTVSPQGNDIFFEGHYYRYVDSGSKSIDWPSSVLAAGTTSDPYFGGRGYIATATTQAENSILLRLVENGAGELDHWDDAWMGGLWQRNRGTLASPTIIRNVDGNELTFNDIDTTTNMAGLLRDYSLLWGDFVESDQSTYICNIGETVRYYWIDGPEAGEELPNNSAGFMPWHATGGIQDEPNSGDFVYIGWQGAYWDDLSAYPGDSGSSFDKLDGYIVEFSGFDGGTSAGVIKEATKTTAVYTATIYTYVDGTLVTAPGNVELRQNGYTVATASSSEEGIYTAEVPDGTYNIYVNDEDTRISIDGLPDNASVNYYTVNFSVNDAGSASGSTISATADGTIIASGTVILAGRTIVITAEGSGASAYTYSWFGDGTNNETTPSLSISSLNSTVDASCTVTGPKSHTNRLPKVVTEFDSHVIGSGARLYGNVISSGGTTIIERGFVVSTTAGPFIGRAGVTKVTAGSGTGKFSSNLTGLLPDTIYYVRAYAISKEGVAYGATIPLSTTIVWEIDNIPKTGDGDLSIGLVLLGGSVLCGCLLMAIHKKRA